MYAIKRIFRFVASPVLHESVRFETPLPGHCKSLGVCVSLWRKSTNANPLFPIAIVHRSQRTIRDTFAWIELRRRVSVQWRNWRECDGWKSRTESLEFRREKRPSVALLPFVIRNEKLCGWKPSAETRLQPGIQQRSKIHRVLWKQLNVRQISFDSVSALQSSIKIGAQQLAFIRLLRGLSLPRGYVCNLPIYNQRE